MPFNINRYRPCVKKKKSILRKIKIYWKLYKKWVKYQYIEYDRKQEETHKNEIKEIEIPQENKKNNFFEDFTSGCVGCGCLVVIIWGIFTIISWAWHIHWLFGLLVLLLLLGGR